MQMAAAHQNIINLSIISNGWVVLKQDEQQWKQHFESWRCENVNICASVCHVLWICFPCVCYVVLFLIVWAHYSPPIMHHFQISPNTVLPKHFNFFQSQSKMQIARCASVHKMLIMFCPHPHINRSKATSTVSSLCCKHDMHNCCHKWDLFANEPKTKKGQVLAYFGWYFHHGESFQLFPGSQFEGSTMHHTHLLQVEPEELLGGQDLAEVNLPPGLLPEKIRLGLHNQLRRWHGQGRSCQGFHQQQPRHQLHCHLRAGLHENSNFHVGLKGLRICSELCVTDAGHPCKPHYLAI